MLEKNKLAIVVKRLNLPNSLKLGEVVLCIEDMPIDSVINNGRFGFQRAEIDGYWWIQNKHGNWMMHKSCLVRLHDGDDPDEMVKITGKPPSHLQSA